MTHQHYIKQNPEYNMYVVNKVFGDGKTLIKFFYRDQIHLFNQGFLAYVDSKAWEEDKYKVHEEVEKYLAETEGTIDKTDWAREMEEDGFDCCINNTNNYHCEKHEKEYMEWFKDQFPKIDLEYGGVCNYDIAK